MPNYRRYQYGGDGCIRTLPFVLAAVPALALALVIGVLAKKMQALGSPPCTGIMGKPYIYSDRITIV